MQAHLLSFALCLFGGFVFAQAGSTPKNDLDLHRITGVSFTASSQKMPCSTSNTLAITSCQGETPATGDNDPSDGAFMNWSATGAALYYVVIYTVLDTFEIVNPDITFTDNPTVFEPNQPDGVSFSGGIITGVEDSYSCIPQGIYTVRIWSVQDLNADFKPDRDFDGNIIGCYEECTYDFRPSCARQNDFYLTVDAQDIGCNGSGGSIELTAFRTDNFYCVDPTGVGARIRWQGPDGFTSDQARIDNLEPGVYSVEVMDIYDCTAYWATDIRALDNVAFACRVTAQPSTVGGSDGSAIVDIIAGFGNYVLSWTGPVSGSTTDAADGLNQINNLPAGDYVFTLLDTRSTCTEDCVLTIPALTCDTPVAGVIDVQNSDCDGNRNGRIEIQFSGGFNPVLTWAGPGVDGRTTRILEDIGPGVYTYTVTDDRGCIASAPITVIAEPSFDLECAATDESLPFLDDGSILISLTGGAPLFSLSYVGVNAAGDTIVNVANQAVANGDTLQNLAAATYFLTVVDTNGCTRTCVSTVSEPDCDIFPNCVPQNPVSIFGNGSVTLTFDSSPDWFVTVTGPLDTSFVTSNPTVFLDELPQGDYAVSVYNSAGCLGNCSFAIIPPPCTLGATVQSRNPSCFGQTNGRIQVNVTGASEGLLIDWDNDAFDGRSVVDNLPAGRYVIRVSDRTECPLDSLVVELTEPPLFEVDLVEVAPISCFESTDGVIAAVLTGGRAPITYEWSIPAPTDADTLRNLPAGTYSLRATDRNGCTDDAQITLRQPAPLTMTCSATAETLANSTDGTISVAHAGARGRVMLSGDLGTFSLVANGDTTFTNLGPGTYNLVITDEQGCTADCQAIVNPGPCMIGTTMMTTQPDCEVETGSATVVVTNPFGAVSYQWNDGNTDRERFDLTPGRYTVTVTDASGCQSTAEARINPFSDFPSLISADLSPVCDTGCTSFSIVVSGTPPFTLGYTFQQANGLVQGRNLSLDGSGAFTLCPDELGLDNLGDVIIGLRSLTDGNGCGRELDRMLTVTRYAPAVGRLDTMICPGTGFSLLGTRFDADNPSGSISLPQASGNGCDSTLLVSVTFFAPAFSALNMTLCPGGEFPFFGRVFNANNRTGDVVVPTPSATGCDSTVRLTINFREPAIGELQATVCPSTVFEYEGALFTASQPTGRVRLPGRSVNGCDSLVDVSVDFYEPARGTFDTLICRDTRANYYGNFFDRNRLSGEVRLPIPSVNGCDSIVLVTVGIYPEVVGVFDTTICEGDTWQFGDVLFEGAADNVIVLLDEPNSVGCDSLVRTTVRTRALPRITLSGDGVICRGDEVSLQVTYTGEDPAQIVLSSDPNELISLTSGRSQLQRLVPAGTTIRILRVESSSVCTPVFSGEVTVRESDLDVGIAVEGIGATLDCADDNTGELRADISGGVGPFTYNWSGGRTSQRLRNLGAGTYEVVVVSAQGCQAQAIATLVAPPPLELDFEPGSRSCVDTLPSVIVRGLSGGVGPYLVRSNQTGGFLPIDSLNQRVLLREGRNLVEVEDANGCRAQLPFVFGPLPEEEIVVSPLRSIIVEGDSAYVQVSTTLDAVSYQLSPGLGVNMEPMDFFVGPTEYTQYTITAIDAQGCTVSADFEVIVDDFVPVYAPNVFTPDGDGVNDLFRLYAANTVIAFNSFEIFSRWGGKLYTLEKAVDAQDPNWGWDGRRADGKVYEQDVYVFKAEVELSGGRIVEITGDLLLMR